MNRKVVTLVLAGALLLPALSPAGTIRISFLNEAGALQETIGILKSNGCEDDAVEAFQQVVERYNETPLALDTNKFPRLKDGFYSFESTARLVAALPHQLCDVKHPYEFNCFDTVILLASGRLRSALRPDDLLGPILVPRTTTNGGFNVVPAATARDACALAHTPWYRDVGESAMPKRMLVDRICLTATMFRWYVLKFSTTEQRLGDGVMEALRANWKSQNLLFSRKLEVVLCHEVCFPQRMFCTAHAGLLLPRARGYTYLEKDGGTGPFVRLDFEDKADLRVWLSAMFQGAERLGYTHHFVTFNDASIEPLDKR